MQIVVDDTRYSNVAKAFLRKFVPVIVSVLEESQLLKFDPDNITWHDINIVYTMCFVIFGKIEDHHGFISGGQKYVSHLAFGDRPNDPPELLLGQRTALHGGLDDDIIIEAIKVAAKPKQ